MKKIEGNIVLKAGYLKTASEKTHAHIVYTMQREDSEKYAGLDMAIMAMMTLIEGVTKVDKKHSDDGKETMFRMFLDRKLSTADVMSMSISCLVKINKGIYRYKVAVGFLGKLKVLVLSGDGLPKIAKKDDKPSV